MPAQGSVAFHDIVHEDDEKGHEQAAYCRNDGQNQAQLGLLGKGLALLGIDGACGSRDS